MFGAASISALTVPHIDRRSVGAAIVDLARTGKRREPFATHCIERLIGLAEAFRRLRKTRGSDDRTFAAGNGHVTEHLVVRRMPRRQAHDDAREVGALAGVLLRQVEPPGTRGGDGRRHRKRDAAAGAGLERSAHGLARILQRM